MRKSDVVITLICVALVGCGGNPGDVSEIEPGQEFSESHELVLDGTVHHLDDLCREPMLVEHPNGTLFVSGYGSQVTGTDPNAPPNLWKSEDGGSNWSRVFVGTTDDGARGNSDVDLAVAPDGTLYFTPMGFDRSTGEGTHIAVGVSRDVGETWDWTTLAENRFVDRPWVAIAPDGSAHVIWNDGKGVSHSISTDGGRTWEGLEKVHPQGGSSHLAVGPGGELAVRITPLSASGHQYDEGVELIAVSTDRGKTWALHEAPGTREWDPTFGDSTMVPRWVEPLAWDSGGVLFHLWSEGVEIKLARSLDLGETWSVWMIASHDEIAYFPFLAASGPGELAATWFSGSGDNMVLYVARIDVPKKDGEPVVVKSRPFQQDAWSEGETPRARNTGGEYIPVSFLADGGLGVVTTIQDAQNDRFGFSWWKIKP